MIASSEPIPPDCAHVAAVFERQADLRPDAIAVSLGANTLSYRQLNERANRLAHHLRGLQVSTDDRVGIFLPRSLDMVVAVLAVLKAGGAYVPLDPTYPRERLNLMLEDARARVLLTHSAQLSQAPGSAQTTLCLDLETPRLNRGPATNPEPASAADDLAYVIYTSGSTGRPKGVAMPHGPLLNLLRWQAANSVCTAGSRTAQFTSLSFDVSFQEIFATWAVGGTLVMLTESQRQDPTSLWQLLIDERIERLFLPFVALRQLAEVGASQSVVPSSLREIITAGEQLQIVPRLVELFERLPRCRLHNQYGPTESHVVTAFTLPARPAEWPTLPPIGAPIANTRILLLDEQRQPVKAGDFGELFIGGDCLARGYLDQPRLTAERFIPDPFSEESGARLYRTGDLARCRPDGNFEFLGRIDHQVKVRGYRVELGEIESALHDHPKISSVVVVACEEVPGHKRLVAFYQPRDTTPVPADALQKYVGARLPEYMVPSVFVPLAQLPLTPSGKVDRGALARLPIESMVARTSFVSPRDTIETALASIWADVLHTRAVGVTENFFEIGGDSLLAVQLTQAIQERLGRPLPLSRFLAHPTIEALARHMRTVGAEHEDRAVLRGSGPDTPLFHVPGPAGVEFLPEPIARELAGERAFFDALQYPGVDGKQPPADRVEDIAAALVKQVRHVRPHGPYCLSGYCMGGVVAYEVARQLAHAGERIERLIMWDAFPARFFKRRPWHETIAELWQRFRSSSRAELAELIRNRTEPWRRRAERLACLWFAPGEADAGFSDAQSPNIDPAQIQRRVLAASDRAYSRYHPRPSSLPVVLCRSRHFFRSPFKEVLPLLGWEHVVRGSIRVHEFECEHEDLLQGAVLVQLAETTALALRATPSARRQGSSVLVQLALVFSSLWDLLSPLGFLAECV